MPPLLLVKMGITVDFSSIKLNLCCCIQQDIEPAPCPSFCVSAVRQLLRETGARQTHSHRSHAGSFWFWWQRLQSAGTWIHRTAIPDLCFLSSDIPFSLHSAMLLPWLLLVGRPAWLVFLSVFWVVGWNVCVMLKGWWEGKALLLTAVCFY